jgi:hypothetical protein
MVTDLEIALLPPISRGAHLDGPKLHAQRLTELWEVADDVDVTLADAFRLLELRAVEGAVWRAISQVDDIGDGRHWIFPNIDKLLSDLRELVWQAMLAGALPVTAIRGVRGRNRCAILPAELARLTPDWDLSRLVADGSDQFIDVRVGRAPITPVKKAWRKQYSTGELKAATEDIAKTYGPDERPSFEDFWKALKTRLPDVTKRQAQVALEKFAPRLRGRRGYRSTKSPS